MSSNPTLVCICINSTPNCNITQYNVTVYPGEIFQIPAVAVGQRFGTVPFTVQSNFVSNYKTIPQMEQFHYAQTVRKECTKLTYSIRSSNTFEMMQLQVDKFEVPEDTSIDHALTFHADLPTSIRTQFINLQVYIKLHSCPLGFAFDENLLMCSCASQLHMNKIACNISTKRVSRPTSFWINATHADNKSSVVIVHPYCPFDYTVNLIALTLIWSTQMSSVHSIAQVSSVGNASRTSVMSLEHLHVESAQVYGSCFGSHSLP